MKDSVQKVCNFIKEHPGQKTITPEEIEAYLRKIKSYFTEDNSDWNLYVLSLSMLSSLANSGYCTVNEPIGPSLDYLQECAREYLEESKEEKFSDLQLFGEAANIENYLPIKADYETVIDTLLYKRLPDLVNQGETELKTGANGKEIVVVNMDARSIDGVTIEGDYDLFHQAVFNAFISLLLSGNICVTDVMIQHFLSQNYGSNVSDNTTKEINAAFDDLQVMNVKIDMSGEAEKRGLDPETLDYFNRGAKMLNLDWIEISLNGNPHKAYMLSNPSRMPIVYEHALQMGSKQSSKGQIVTKPASLNLIRDKDTGKPLKATKNRVALRTYLKALIIDMQKDHTRALNSYNSYLRHLRKGEVPTKTLESYEKMSYIINYDTAFKKAGLEIKSRASRIHYRNYLESCLTTWHDAGEIEGYSYVYNGSRSNIETGVKILLDKPSKKSREK